MIDQIFYWIGVASSGFFVLLGMAIFAGWVMDMVWRKFKDVKNLYDIINIYNTRTGNGGGE